jgi:thiamine biosynthesis lipoprotein
MTAGRAGANDFVELQRVSVSLGTFVAIDARLAGGSAQAQGALDSAWEAFARVDERMHPTRPGSDLRAIADSRPGERVPVHPWTFATLTLARQMWQDSNHLFDPCVPELAGRMGDIDLVAPYYVRRGSPPLALDLGGIAKGFAIDRAIEALQAARCTSGQVNAGGDVRHFGDEPGRIAIRIRGVLAGCIELGNEALAISEPRSDLSPAEHRGFYSPLTAAAIEGRFVAIVAASAAVADALTKCAIVCPASALAGLLDAHGARLVEESVLAETLSPGTENL